MLQIATASPRLHHRTGHGGRHRTTRNQTHSITCQRVHSADAVVRAAADAVENTSMKLMSALLARSLRMVTERSYAAPYLSCLASRS